MNPQQHSVLSPRQVARILVVHAKSWLVPAVVVGLLAAVYAVVHRPTWESSQALIVRDEVANNEDGPGKFSHADEMKAVQETILELTKSRGVLTAALDELGPPADYTGNAAAWPTPRDVADLRDAIQLAPPKGAEFGKTEVFYLRVSDHDRDRAVALNDAICDRLQARFQQLLDAKAQSVIHELVKKVQLAKADLDESTARLTAIEKEVGSDLAELRVLNEVGSGESTLRRTMSEIHNELRQARAAEKANRQLLVLLKEAQDDPGRLVATPNSLLVSQPALRRLKDGLLDAQIATAGLKGNRSDAHPLVVAAKQSEEEIGRHLHDELAIAVRGLQIELRLNSERLVLLDEQLADATGRLRRLAQQRAGYANQLAETNTRAKQLEQAEQRLGDARATHFSAGATNLISRVDVADAGTDPVGPGRSTIVAVGIATGLLIGLGVLFLTVPPVQPVVESAAEARPAELAVPTPHEPVSPAPISPAPVSPVPVSSVPVSPPPLPAGPIEPAFASDRRLSLKEALQKIEYGSCSELSV